MIWSKVRSGWAILALTTAALAAAGPAIADWALDFPPSATELGNDIRFLHHTALIICVVIGVIVFGALGYSLVKFRKSQGAQAAKFSHSTKAEVIWTVIPVLILIGLAIPTARTLIEMEDTQSADLRIVVTGYQWKWRYEYPDHGISFFSNITEESKAAAVLGAGVELHEHYLRDVDNPMVVPVGSKVKLQLTSNDVIHAWWIPELYVKRDAVPGTINETWFRAEETGVFRGQCAELCGRGHGFMPIVVEVVEEEEFNAWAAAQVAGKAPKEILNTAASLGGPNAR
ncbi:cytochrome c oxidase subunit II [Candidatus Foliamicus sp.]